MSRASRRASRHSMAVVMALGLGIIGCSSGDEGSDGTSPEERPASAPVPVAFVVERTVFTNDEHQIAEYLSTMEDTLEHCAVDEPDSCQVVTYTSDAVEVTGERLPHAPAFRPNDGQFYSLAVDAAGLDENDADRLRATSAVGYLDAVEEDLRDEQNRGCLDPFTAIRHALADLQSAKAPEKHIIVMGSGLWNCPPLQQMLASNGERLTVDEAVADALTLVSPDSADGVEFHFTSFGRAFVESGDIMHREEIQWLEDVWSTLVERWGGTTARAPAAGFEFP